MPAASCDSAGMRTPHSAWEVFRVFLRLGLTVFGGPVAHLAFFRDEFVRRRQWLTEEAYFELLALCQFLPGPASSQVGFSVGLLRAGWRGGLAAWCGFTLPSVLLLLAFAMLAPRLGGPVGTGLIHGLKLIAVAVVAQAVSSTASARGVRRWRLWSRVIGIRSSIHAAWQTPRPGWARP